MSELSAAFEGLDDAFNTEFEGTDEEQEENEKALQVIEDEIKDIELRKENVKNGIIEMKDADFLTKEIKSLVLSSRSVLQRLDTDIKVGSNARMYEVYADMTNAITNQFKELRQLNESIAKIMLDQNKLDINTMQKNDKISLTADQLLDMVNTASQNSQMNEVDAEFTIEDDGVDMSDKDKDDDEDGEVTNVPR